MISQIIFALQIDFVIWKKNQFLISRIRLLWDHKKSVWFFFIKKSINFDFVISLSECICDITISNLWLLEHWQILDAFMISLGRSWLCVGRKSIFDITNSYLFVILHWHKFDFWYQIIKSILWHYTAVFIFTSDQLRSRDPVLYWEKKKREKRRLCYITKSIFGFIKSNRFCNIIKNRLSPNGEFWNVNFETTPVFLAGALARFRTRVVVHWPTSETKNYSKNDRSETVIVSCLDFRLIM